VRRGERFGKTADEIRGASTAWRLVVLLNQFRSIGTRDAGHPLERSRTKQCEVPTISARKGRNTHRGRKRVADAIRIVPIAGGKPVPPPNGNLLYFVYLPPGITFVQGGARSCQAFCGYHDAIDSTIFYAAMPYPELRRLPRAALGVGCTHGDELPRVVRGNHGRGARYGLVR
jgi:hypothetical protein